MNVKKEGFVVTQLKFDFKREPQLLQSQFRVAQCSGHGLECDGFMS